MKRKPLLISALLILVVIAVCCIAVLFAIYRDNMDRNNSTSNCQDVIAEVQAESKSNPLYEPPRQYFECTDAI
jgi:ABC-type cobalt transport system substrate-binding protein